MSPTFFDSASRIRRLDATGRLTTLAGNGLRGDTATPGPARETALPNVTQILFNRQGTLYFIGAGRVFGLSNGLIEAFAALGRPGFNGESGPATEINFGAIVKAAVDSAGQLRTVAAGRVGDERPATAAAANRVYPILRPDGNVETGSAPYPAFTGTPLAIATDRAGNIYWANSGANPTGGVFTAEITSWNWANSGLTNYSVVGLAAIGRNEASSSPATRPPSARLTCYSQASVAPPSLPIPIPVGTTSHSSPPPPAPSVVNLAGCNCSTN